MKPFASVPLPLAEIDRLVRERVAWILSACTPSRIFVFGSAASGAMHAGSDLDLLVILFDGSDVRAAERAILGRPPPHFVPMDLLVYDESTFERRAQIGGVCFIVKKEGKLIFSQESAEP